MADKQIGTAIIQLQTDSKSRPICKVEQMQVSTAPGSEGWLLVTLSTGSAIRLSPEAVQAIQHCIKVPGHVQYRREQGTKTHAAKAGR